MKHALKAGSAVALLVLFTAFTSAGILQVLLRRPGGSQPQPEITLISQSALIKISFQAMMFEGVSIMPGPGHRVCDSQQLSIQGADDLVVNPGTFVFS